MNAAETIQKMLEDIIDGNNVLFKPITDEETIENTDEYSYYTRTFSHANGKKYKMKWKTYHGTPETVKTIFEPAETL